MVLELGSFPVSDVVLDSATRLEGEVLHVDSDALSSLVLEDLRIKRVAVEVVRPGESARIIHLRDVVEPRVRVEGEGCVFPQESWSACRPAELSGASGICPRSEDCSSVLG